MKWNQTLVFSLLVFSLSLFGCIGESVNATQTNVQLRGAFLSIHLEVSSNQVIAQAWPQLASLIEEANGRDFDITLMFSPQWATYVYDNDLLNIVHQWEDAGHEIALHHHGPSHATFDGYTNDRSRITPSPTPGRQPYQGTMLDLIALMLPLSQQGMISASMTDEDIDWPAGFRFNASTPENGGPSKEGLLSSPALVNYVGQPVVQISKSGYAIERLDSTNRSVNLTDIENGLQTAISNQLMGLVINDDTLINQLDRVWDLFDLLDQYQVQLQTLRVLLER